jgi:hypothetical protein
VTISITLRQQEPSLLFLSFRLAIWSPASQFKCATDSSFSPTPLHLGCVMHPAVRRPPVSTQPAMQQRTTAALRPLLLRICIDALQRDTAVSCSVTGALSVTVSPPVRLQGCP